MWLIILIIVLTFLIYFFGIKPLKYWKERRVPSVKGWPFVGNMGPCIFCRQAIIHVMEDIYKAHPEKRYVGFYSMATPALMLRDPDLIKQITVKEFETFPEHRRFLPDNVDTLWSKNLFAMRGGEKWHDMRATLSPSFTSSKMRMMFELMRDCAKQFSNYFLKEDEIVTVEINDAFTRFTNDVIASTAFGVTCDSLEHRENEFYKMGKETTGFTGLRFVAFFLYVFCPALAKLMNIPIFTKAASKFFRGLIDEAIEVREKNGIIRPDMIHLLMEARKGRLRDEDHTNQEVDSGFSIVQESQVGRAAKKQKTEITNEDIAAQAFVFFIAGFGTVSTMLCYATYELAINPDIQEKLRREVDEVMEQCKGHITYKALLGMTYLDMIITETLRKWPPNGITDRRAVKPFTIEPEQPGEKPLHLDSGSICFLPIYPIHRDPKYYPNPEKFDPERFSEENKHNIKPFTYLPFGAGPRNCIGSRFAVLEAKVVLAEIISKLEIIPVEETPIPIIISKKSFGFLPDKGIPLGLKPRNVRS